MQKSLLFSAALVAVIGAPSVLAAQQQPPTRPVPSPSQPATPSTKPDSAAKVDSAAKAAQPPVRVDSAAGDVVPAGGEAAAIDAAFEGDAELSTFAAIARAANLAETIAQSGPVTILVPSDSAFAKLPVEQRDALLADSTQLRAFLLSHIVPGRVTSADAASLGSAKNAAGGDVAIVVADGKVTVGGAAVTRADVAAGKSVIHVIDTILLPAAPAAPAAPTAPTVPPVQPDSGR